ncbi:MULTISPECIES: hypothetical protein [unclassified Pseudoalteromonas]|uniref:hypothetical protein n=1 Tax=unclassified Pseudoalteromonas TaxID=194690 RepID=UPI002096838D|nr:hypothetical protein [Pseudoalteromonas sp. XMcav2-N]MCO7188552.1 hypothetical protein [Pseudoalteromonas sp. XMcav2-N]
MDIEKIEKDVKRSRVIVVLVFTVVLGSYIGWFWMLNQQPISSDSGVWGAFGDFVGGILNPLIAFAAFYWLTQSVLVQKQELAETKKALTDSSKAQLEQAKLQKNNMRISYLTTELATINIELEAEYAYRNTMFEREGSRNQGSIKSRKLLDKNGRHVDNEEKLFHEIDKEINSLKRKQESLLHEIRHLSNET